MNLSVIELHLPLPELHLSVFESYLSLLELKLSVIGSYLSFLQLNLSVVVLHLLISELNLVDLVRETMYKSFIHSASAENSPKIFCETPYCWFPEVSVAR